MNTAVLITALDLPAETRVDKRVPKKLLVEHGSPTTTDKRRISDGVDEVCWLAVLKPTTIGVPTFRNEVREYLEIAVLSVVLRAKAKTGRLRELIHRAVPYPIVLIAAHGESISMSLVHKRWSQSEAGATILDGELVTAELTAGERGGFGQTFRESLALSRQPRTHMYDLYQSWLDKVLALLAARVTGTFLTAGSPEQAAAQQAALREHARLDAEINRLRAAAAKEKQVARQVELNVVLKRFEHQRSAAKQRL